MSATANTTCRFDGHTLNAPTIAHEDVDGQSTSRRRWSALLDTTKLAEIFTLRYGGSVELVRDVRT